MEWIHWLPASALRLEVCMSFALLGIVGTFTLRRVRVPELEELGWFLRKLHFSLFGAFNLWLLVRDGTSSRV